VNTQTDVTSDQHHLFTL